MTTREVTANAPRAPLAPIDESVVLPKAVTDATARANAFYNQPEPAPVAPPDPAASAQTAEGQPTAPAQPEPVQSAPVQDQGTPQPAPQTPPAPAQEPNWEHQYKSMKGRYEQAMDTINLMQGQMTDLGNELMRTQALVGQQTHQPVQPETLITDHDREQYGDDMLDVVQRVAQQAVQPHLQKLENENQELRQTLRKNAFANVNQTLDQHIPNWREINKSVEFKRWLSLLDIYSGQVRGKMLNAAYQAADAPRVVAFFQGFLQDMAATGHDPQPQPNSQPAPATGQPARTAAVDLTTLAAPGRPRPASGGTQVNETAKQSFTRQQVSDFYSNVRRGIYAGRDAEKNQLEQAIFAAQREGRIR